jgi:hypothetical protein
VSENLIESIAPHLAPPVVREPIHSARDTEDGGAELAVNVLPYVMFADDDAE